MPEKVIVVTGASGGIGAELALQLSRQGHRVVLAARRRAELEAVARQCGPGALPVPTDVTRRREVDALRDAALGAHGRVDAWINNAGQGITRSVLDLSDADVDHMMLVNVKSALYGMQAIVPHFQERNSGHLINVSSFLARAPLAPFRSAYSAAKAALNSLTANLRMDLAVSHPGVTVSVVMPGIVRTSFGKNALGGLPVPGTDAGVPSQSAEEVAAAMVELLDRPRAECVTNPDLIPQGLAYVRDGAAFEAALRSPRP